MAWNARFEQAALIISLVLALSYMWKKHLPFRSWNYFSWLIGLEVGSCFTNVVACHVLENGTTLPVFIVYFLNILYYFLFTMQIWAFAIFTIAMTGKSRSISKRNWFLFASPYCIMMFCSVLTPVLHIMFYFDSNGTYYRGWGYYPIWILFLAFYLLIPISFAWYYKTRMTPRRMVYTFTYWGLVVLGMLLQGIAFPNILLEGIFNLAAILIIHVDIQNPAMYMDADTGLYNQWALGEVLEEKIEYDQPIGLIAIGIEDFSILESIYGRSALMQVVFQIGEELSKQFSYIDVFYIHRGRFVLLSRRNKEESNSVVTEAAIRRRFEQPWLMEHTNVLFHINMARLPYDLKKESIREIFTVVDHALTEVASHQDELTMVIGEKQMQEVRSYFVTEQRVNKCIRENLVQMVYQPIFSVAEQRIVYVEALARIHDEEIGDISPDVFIPIAEKNGSIGLIGSQIFEKVCSFIQDSDMEDLGLSFIAVNLSPIQCRSEDFSADLFSCMERYEVPPQRLHFEITESAITDRDVLMRMMDKIRKWGSEFSLDDYGTGYSNLIQVLDLPFKIVKIDKSIVWAYFSGKAEVLPGIISTFRGRGYEVVAEGVETQEMAETLMKMGCDYLQGFYYSKALEAGDLIPYIYRQRRKKVMEENKLL